MTGAASGEPEALGAFRGPDLPDLDGLRRCVHCGICLPQCPTYRVLGEEMDSPRGRLYLMRAVAEGRLDMTETFVRHMDLCLGCRACETACPAGVPFGHLLESTRAQIASHATRPSRGRLGRLVLSLFPEPGRLTAAFHAARLYQWSGVQALVRATGVLRAVPRLAALEALLDRVPVRTPLPAVIPAEGRRLGRAGLVTGCVQNHLFPTVHRDTARLLARAGWEVVVPPEQGCCGALELHAGRLEALRWRARSLAAAFPDDVDIVVTSAAGCGSAMKEYDHWLADEAVERFARRTRDVSEVLAAAALPLGRLDLMVTYHDACHLAHGQRVRAEPRALLRRIPGLVMRELADSDLCCGSAGVYNIQEPEMADRLLALKLERIQETGAHMVVTGNPGCALQIAKGARQRGLPLEVVHPVELLARAVDAAVGTAGGARGERA